MPAAEAGGSRVSDGAASGKMLSSVCNISFPDPAIIAPCMGMTYYALCAIKLLLNSLVCSALASHEICCHEHANSCDP